jgi:PAS domain S-box-containing protein
MMNPRPELRDHRARILVVDDERQNRALLEVMLAPEGFEVISAGSGEEAIAIVTHHPPDLILLDLMMPGMDGYDVARRVKGNLATRNIPIIMVTAHGDRDARMRGLGAGAEDFLSKPVDRAELTVRVKNLLRLKAFGDYYSEYSEALEQEVQERTADLAERSKRLAVQTAALLRSEERTNYALGGARMGLWELDVATQRLTWSDTMATLFGLTPRQVPAGVADFLMLVHADDRQVLGGALSAAVSTEAKFEMDFRALLPDGSTRWLAGRARMMRDADGTPLRLLGVGADVTDRKSLESQLRQSQKMEAVGQLAGGVAHDFNNMLTVIMSYCDLVMNDLRPGDPAHDDLMQVVGAATSAASLTRQLLAFSRNQVLRPTTIDVNELVTGMEKMLGRLIQDSVALVTVLEPDLMAVRADHGQLEQVLMNLVVNARDAMPKGGRLTIETSNVELDGTVVSEASLAAGEYAKLAVSDTGTGMDDATKERLFEPFFTTKDAGKGTGLGLATVYGIVQQSGGFIGVDTALGKGTTFSVYLPRFYAAGEVAPSAAPTIVAASAMMRSRAAFPRKVSA